MRIYLTGGWGYGNLGDDAILKAMLRSISETFGGSTLTLTSFNPAETHFHHGLEAEPSLHAVLAGKARGYRSKITFVWRTFLMVVWWLAYKVGKRSPTFYSEFERQVSLIDAADLVVLGGGGYFNDVWKGSFVARLGEILIASTLKKKIMIYGQTVGPFSSPVSTFLLRRLLETVSFITYRDAQSLRTLEKCGFDIDKSLLTADEAILLEAGGAREAAFDKYKLDESKLLIGLMVQKFRAYVSVERIEPLRDIKDEQAYFDNVLTALIHIHHASPVQFLFLPSTSWDMPFCRKVYESLPESARADSRLIVDVTIKEYIELCQHTDMMISTNMHPLILATTNAVPFIAVSYFYKVDDFVNALDMEEYLVRIDELSTAKLIRQFNALQSDLDSAKLRLLNKREAIRVRASRNIEVAERLVETIQDV